MKNKYLIKSFFLHLFLLAGIFLFQKSQSIFKDSQQIEKTRDLTELDTIVIAEKSSAKSIAKPQMPIEAKSKEVLEEKKTIPEISSNSSLIESKPLSMADSTGAFQEVTLAEYRQWVAKHNPAPEYPRISRIRGDQGKVLIKALVKPDGHAEISLEKSSGFEALDIAALLTVKKWNFPRFQNQSEIVIIIPYQFSFEE